MVNKARHIIILAFLFCIGLSLSAQNIDAFARVSVSPREGVVRQAYKVKISVYSGTWFSKPLQFSNLRIDDAFIIPFTRTQSSISYINKKKYATLTFYYLVFPYSSGDLEIPEVTMTTSIPPEGGYEGIVTTIKTKPQKIKVDPLPDSEDKLWMVAKSAYISENWNKATNELKVGDVIQRTITLRANGTLPSLIAPFIIDEPDKVSIYAESPVLQDKRTDEDVNGVRIESYSYLFEQEGEVIIPAEEIVWWNPYSKKVYKRTLPEQVFTIAPNPELAMLQSIKDSLEAINAPVLGEMESAKYPLKRTILLSLLVLFSFWVTYRMTKREFHRAIERRHAYLQSEPYYFSRVRKASKGKDSQLFLQELYLWFDHFRKEEIRIKSYLNKEDTWMFENIIQSLYKNDRKSYNKKDLLALANRIRKAVLQPSHSATEDDLNP